MKTFEETEYIVNKINTIKVKIPAVGQLIV